jgi:hypothetical protein
MSAAYRKRHQGSSKGDVKAQKRRNRERQAERRRPARAEALEDVDVTKRGVPSPGSRSAPDPGPDPLGQLLPHLRRAGSPA